MKRRILQSMFFVIAATGLYAQNPAPAQEKAADWQAPRTAYVRRLSLGATVTVLPMNLIKLGYTQTFSTTPVLQIDRDTSSKALRIGWGATGQLALSEKTALAFGALRRRAEYNVTETTYYGEDKPGTVIDDRKTSMIQEWTRVAFWDFPFVMRYYSKRRHSPGARWFLQAGGTYRTVDKLRGRLEKTSTAGAVTTDHSYQAPHKKSIMGITAGFGVHLIDPVGVRVIPEVRYTRWFGTTFDNWPPRSARNQLEVNVSLGF